MASNQDFVDFVCGQIQNVGEISAKKMFGEYGIYSDGKIFALICDNHLYIKPTQNGKDFIGKAKEAPPYPGANLYLLIEEQIEDSDWLSQLVRITLEHLPESKRKK